MDKKVMLALLVVGLFAAFEIAYLMAPANPNGTGPKYFEIVMEQSNCPQGGCFIEYLFLSNGISVKKQFDTPDYNIAPSMRVRRLDKQATESLFSQMQSFLSANAKGNGATDKNNLFLYDGKKLYAYSAQEPATPEFLALFQNASSAFYNAGNSEDFYVHEYYQPISADTSDFHIFSDGTVISSIFGSNSNNLAYTGMFASSPEYLAKTKELAAKALKATPSPYSQCGPESNLNYGFVEIEQNGTYSKSYTCGKSDDSVSALFSYVRSVYGG